MTKLTDIVIDLETLGTGPDAAVFSIGACALPTGDTFYSRVPLAEATKWGTVDGDTVRWWLQQSEEARDELVRPIGVPSTFTTTRHDGRGVHSMDKMLSDFRDFVEQFGDDVRVYGNGATFDITILETLCARVHITMPWNFYNIRDLRTARDLAQRRFEATGRAFKPDFANPLPHHALHDARCEAEHLAYYFGVLGVPLAV